LTIDFDALVSREAVTTQYPGLVFQNARVLTAGISVNDEELPPRSGVNVAFDDSGPMSVHFASPVLSVGGFFTYTSPITLEAFDAFDVSLGTVVSAFSSNLGLSGELGSLPNELLTFASALGIASITITGSLDGGSFTLDDLTLETDAVIPEPSTLLLLAGGAVGLVAARLRRRSA
jgi:hypothetical protein